MQTDVEIQKITPFPSSDGHGRASVTLRCGPMIVRAKILEKDGRRWLAMPARKESNGERWFDHAFFSDRMLHKAVEEEVLRRYERAVHLPQEVVAAEEAYAV